ncbi:MAG: hypothetical protein ACOX6T_14390 [Myxococcales bacterium]|jgi:hypothetical protein
MTRSFAWIAISAGLFAACGPADDSSSDPITPDAALLEDAGQDSDAGEDLDAGEVPDAGESADAGAEPDAGEPAEPEVWQSGTITVTEHPGAAWQVEQEGAEVVARYEGTGLALVIDPTNGSVDGRYSGIYVHLDDSPLFAGRYNGTDASVFVPDRPWMSQTQVTVVAERELLIVEMLEGSLSQVPDSHYPSDEPFRWRSTWSLETEGLRVASAGLYYVLPSKQSCALTITGEGDVELGTLDIQSDTSPFLRYYEDVRSIEVASADFGSFTIATDAEILQVEVPRFPDTELFELDFDHSFKDRGQTEVHTEMVLPLAL